MRTEPVRIRKKKLSAYSQEKASQAVTDLGDSFCKNKQCRYWVLQDYFALYFFLDFLSCFNSAFSSAVNLVNR